MQENGEMGGNMGNFPLSISIRRSLIHSLSQTQRASPRSFSVLVPLSRFQVVLLSPGNIGREKNKLTTGLVAIQMLVFFPDSLATIYL